MRILGVKYKNNYSKDFNSKVYTYFEKEGLGLMVGDIVLTPTGYNNALSVAKVVDVDISENQIASFRSAIKTISLPALTDEEKKERGL